MYPVLNSNIGQVLADIQAQQYWTDRGVSPMGIFEWIWRSLLSFFPCVDSVTQVCAQRTFEQINAAYTASNDETPLIISIRNAEHLVQDLAFLTDGQAYQAHAYFMTFLTQTLQLNFNRSPPRMVPADPLAQAGAEAPVDPFDALDRISEEDKETVRRLITTLATNDFDQLFKKEAELRALGAQVAGIHPFRFLEYLFGEGNLATEMQVIRGTGRSPIGLWRGGFGKKGFLPDFKGRVVGKTREYEPLLPGFSRSLNVDEATVRRHVMGENWNDLFAYLIAAKIQAGGGGRA